MKQKLVFLDIDGVLLDFYGGFSNYLKECKNIQYPKQQTEIYTHNTNIEKTTKGFQGEKVFFDHYAMEFMQGEYFSRLEAIIDLPSYQRLAAVCDIFLVTNVPNECRVLREKNLKLRGLDYQELFFAGEEKYDSNYPSKYEVIKKVATAQCEIIFLDDLIINCSLVKQEIPGADVFLLDKPYNQKNIPQNYQRVKNWQHFVDNIL